MRQRLEHPPEDAGERAWLTRTYQALTAEFTRRARAAWTPDVQPDTLMPAPHHRQPNPIADDYTRKRLLAIEVLLEEPEEISDGLYALRDRLQAIALA